ncbi:hypothetical protein NIES2107_74920 (plasmid) [Nostoc carneum NIES-2107]|nr:hypothetical protein NIES2107_74920 [Nostoc carneum NIES-2107]
MTINHISVLFLNYSYTSNSFSQEREKVLHFIESRSNLTLQKSESLEDTQSKLAAIDILIMWVGVKESRDWEKLDSFMKEQNISYVGFIVIFAFDGHELMANMREALLQKKRAFVCPINLFALEASIKELAEEMNYKKSLEDFKSNLLKTDSLDSIIDKALHQLQHHPLVGYERATISLVDKNTGSSKRYLLKFDSVDPPNNQPKRRLLKDIQEDKLMMRVDKETIFIIQNLEDLRQNPAKGQSLADLGWDDQEATTKDIKSWLGLAAKHQNQTVAIITLDHTRENKYKPNNHRLVDFLKDFGEIFANIIIDFFSKRNKRVITSIMNEMGNDLVSQDLIKKILVKLRDELKCDNCNYFFVSSDTDNAKKEIFLEELTSAKKDLKTEIQKTRHPFKKGVGIVGTVLQTGESRIVPHAIEDANFIPSFKHTGDNLSLLAVPVIPVSDNNSEEPKRIIGVFSCYKEEKTDYFNVYDRDLVEYIALSAATVIERTMTLESLKDISSKMAELVLDPDKTQLLKQICQHALKMTSAGSASIHLIQHLEKEEYGIISLWKVYLLKQLVKLGLYSLSSQEYRSIKSPYYTYPNGSEAPPRLNGKGTTDSVIENMTTVEFSKKLGNFDRIDRKLRDNGVKSKIVVPLIITKDNQQSLIGALYLNKYSEEPFSKVEKFALELFAKQAASIINDQNTLSENQFRADAHQKFTSAIAEIADKDDIGLLLRDVARYSCELSRASFSFVDIYNDEDKPEVTAAWPEYILTDLKNKSCENYKIGIIGLAARNQTAILINDINEEKKKNSEYWQHYIEYDQETLSELVVPIIDQKNNKVIGVINLEHSKSYAFTKLHQEVIEHFAAQVAIAYQKKSLIDFIKGNNGMLTSLHQSLPNVISESPQNMLYKAVAATRESLGVAEVIVIPFQDKNSMIFNNHPIILKEEIVPRQAAHLIQVLENTSKKVYFNRKDYKLINFVFGSLNISCGLCLPFSAGLKKIGVMWILFSRKIDEKQLENNKDVYQAYANQIALAYENAKKIEELENKETKDLSRELTTYSNDVRKEAKTWFFLSLFSTIPGFILICYGVFLLHTGIHNLLLTNEVNKNNLHKEVTLESKKNQNEPKKPEPQNFIVGALASGSGVILEAVTVLFFNRVNEANKRLDRYHEERVNIGKLSILLAATEQTAPEVRPEEKQSIIHLTANNWFKSTNEVKNTDKEVKNADKNGEVKTMDG